MKKSIHSIAGKFTVYSQLGWFHRWELRRSLRWIHKDTTSLELLLDLERKLEKKSLSSKRIFKILLDALIWYNREGHENRFIKNRIKPDRLPEMMRVVVIFLDKDDHELHHSYRELLLDILNSGDEFAKHHEIGTEITQEQFRLESAEVISNLCQQWGNWHPYLPNDEPGRRWGNWHPYIKHEASRMLGYLENIAHKVSDSQQFITICRDMAPVVGAKTISSLIEMTGDFQEFESYYRRIIAQLKWWHSYCAVLLPHYESISELNQNLNFLETLTKDARIIEYMHYTPTKDSDWKLNSLLFSNVKTACWKQDWRRISEYDTIIDGMIRDVKENVVREHLRITWSNLYASTCSRYSSRYKRQIRWEFDEFTEYVRYEERTRDWTVDNEQSRRYWNWHDAEHKEHHRFFETFKPKFCSLFRTLTHSEIEVLFSLFPKYLSTQEFKKEVDVPVAWNRSIETREGYDKWAGHYSETVEVARPKEFAACTFTFERPYLQDAMDLLDNVDEIHEAIQTYRDSKH